MTYDQWKTTPPDDGEETFGPATEQEAEAEAWQHWHERAIRAEGQIAHFKDNLPPYVAWERVKKWLDDYAWEERVFSRYRDDVILDGIMTAGQRRAISALFSAPNPHRGTP